MKRFLVVLFAGAAAVFASCNDEETGKENKWFYAPEAEVSGTTVEVSCRTKFGDGVLSSAQAGFAYAPIRSDDTGSFTETTDVTVDGQVMSCRLTGLDAETSYLIYAYVDMGSGGRMQSKPVVVKTGENPVLPDDPKFGVPEYSQVTASSATVSCTFEYTGGKEVSEAYFLYGTTSDDGQRVAVATEPGAKSARLTGLSASTEYKFRLCVVVGGTTFGSTVGTFATSAPAAGTAGRNTRAGRSCRSRRTTAIIIMPTIFAPILKSTGMRPATLRYVTVPSTTVRYGWRLLSIIVMSAVRATAITAPIRLSRPLSSLRARRLRWARPTTAGICWATTSVRGRAA